MHGIYKLEELLCNELEEYGKRDDLNAGTLETIDKLSHALKNVQKVIEYYEHMGDDKGYSRFDGYRDGYYTGGSYRRAPKRDRMGRYSRDYSRAGEDMAMELRNLMNDAPEHMRGRIENILSEVERM